MCLKFISRHVIYIISPADRGAEGGLQPQGMLGVGTPFVGPKNLRAVVVKKIVGGHAQS